MTQVSWNLRAAIKLTSAVLCVALALLWTGWHEELRAQGYYTRFVSNFKSNGAFANGFVFDSVTGASISISATQVESQARRPPRSTTASTFLNYAKCQTLGAVFHCDSLNGLLANSNLVGDVGAGPGSPGVLALNVDTANEPGLVYCFSNFYSDTGQSQFECPPGPPPSDLQGNIGITFTQTGDFWSRFKGTFETHSTNFSSRSQGTTTSFQATMTGDILGVEIGQPGWFQSSSIGTNEGVDLTIQIGPSP